MVGQALVSPSEVFAVFATQEQARSLEALCRARNVPLYIGTTGVLAKLIGTGYETAATTVAVVGQKVVSLDTLLAEPDALILCGERIQDPRNIGVLMRTAEAAGCAGLVLSADSAEPFSRQVMRSTTGSILRLPLVLADDLPTALTAARAKGVRVVASSGQAETSVFDADLSARPLIVVVGNEQFGVTDAALAASDTCVRLPMKASGADSLNVTVAAGVLIYEAIRQGG